MATTLPYFAPPPRRVPLTLRVANAFGAVSQVGWALFGFGMIFFWTFTWNADFSFVNFRGPHQRAIGRVTEVRDTNASENDRPVREHHYKYSVAGTTLDGISYVTGRDVAPGETVMIEYDANDPRRSRIEGMRRAQFSPFVLFVVIFPLIGLGILIVATRLGLKRNFLLANGVFTTAKLKSKRATNVEVNRRRVYELTFEFVARDGRRCEATARSSMPSTLEDDAEEPLLYDPEKPEKAYLLDDAGARPSVEGNGELAGRPVTAFALLIVPLLVVAGNALVLLHKLQRLQAG